jgi:oligosaccharide 4-alpha-D-glucosyltransferase
MKKMKHLNYALIFSLSLCFSHVFAANYQSFELQDQSLLIHTDEGQLSLTAYNQDALEVFYQPRQTKQLPSFAIGSEVLPTKVSVTDGSDQLIFNAGSLVAHIQKSPLRITYYQKEKLLLEEEVGLFVQDTVRGFRFKLQDNEKLLGGGERVLGMDRRGHRFPLYNKAHYGYTTESNQMYFGLSAVMSSNKYILVFDNSASGYMDLGHTEKDIMQFEAVGGRTSYLLMAGDTYPELIQHFVEVTGKQPLPPRWAFGNIASRFGYHTEQEARDTVQKFKDEDFPLDAIVLDLYWFGADIKGHMGNLQWDKQAFPNPEKMMGDFIQKGVNTVLITEPFILSSSSKWQDAVDNQALALDYEGKPKRFDFYFGNTGLIDVFDDKASEWFDKIYAGLFAQGVSGWWGDLGEPEVHPADTLHKLDGITVTGDEIHNAYGHKWAERVYNKQLALAPNERPFVMMRSGFVGSQRFGMIPWTGDVSRSWDGLKPQVELSLQMGLLGMAYTHSDLGGFAGGEVFDQEMYVRWLEYGVFQPVYRPHAQDNIAPEPVFHDKQTKDILREYVKLRYRMLPYNYSLAFENSLTGMPLMRPLFFEDEQDTRLIDEKECYMWGDAFLVKPVTSAGIEQVTIRLPKGIWFDYWNDTRYDGERDIKLATSLAKLPVLVRGGSFVPMAEDMASTKAYRADKLSLHYYADPSIKDADGVMYEDDGHSQSSITEKQYTSLHFNAEQQAQTLTITLTQQGQYSGMVGSRDLQLLTHNWTAQPKQVQVGGKKLSILPSNASLASVTEGYFWDSAKHLLVIKFNWHDDVQVKIN